MSRPRLVWSVIMLVGSAGLGLYAHHVVPRQMALAITVAAWSIVVFLVARLAIALRYSLAVHHSNLLIAREQLSQQQHLTRKTAAEARQAEREANTLITIAKAGDQVYLTEVQPNTTTRPLHLAPGQVNGRVWYDEEELRRWLIHQYLSHGWSGQRAGAIADLPALGAGPVDLLAALDNERRVLIVGPSNAGKTTLLHHLMQRHHARSKVVVIDPHASPQKWHGHAHKVFGIGRNYAEIEWGLHELLKLMLKRYDDIGQGLAQEESHPPISILIDEWRAITDNLSSAAGVIKTLLTESRKAAFGVFLASHSERAKPLGLAGEYDLKDGFAIVRLAIVGGQHTATLDTGSGEIPALLPGRFGQPAQIPAMLPDDAAGLVEREYRPELAEPPSSEPTEKQQRILELWDAGERREYAIARDVYNDGGGRQIALVHRTLEKFNRI